jgi:uncharacterized RDD family membrane protein YckC
MPEGNTQAAATLRRPLVRAHLFRRFVASVIDGALLGVIGVLLSFPFSGAFFALGQNGWWIGALIVLVYLTVCQTNLTKGRTLGYEMLGISVIKTNGSYLTYGQAFIRSLLLAAIPFASNLFPTPPSSFALSPVLVISIILSTIYFSYGAAFYCFLLFHPLRRGLQDMASGAIVVNNREYDALSDQEKRQFTAQQLSLKRPIIISAVVVVIIIVANVVMSILLPRITTITNLVDLRQQIMSSVPGVNIQTVQDLHTYSYTNTAGAQGTELFVVTGSVSGSTFSSPQKLGSLATQIDTQVVHLYPQIDPSGDVNVILTSGYSIGIWTYSETANFDSSVQDIKTGTATTTPSYGYNFNLL